MPTIGSHMSIAGGYYKAVETAASLGCDCVQLFTKNNNQWRAKPISPDEAAAFHESLERLQITAPLSHASYLINLATPDATLRQKSIDALVVEVERAHQLKIPNVVVHPGAFTSSTETEGLNAIIAATHAVIAATRNVETRILFENTAGQGSTLGWRFEQLAHLLDGLSKFESRIGVCIDTCHAFAAGYDIASLEGFENAMDDLNKWIGFARIKALHLNDSKKGLGSRVDRHEHIGDGCIGLDGFRYVLRHPDLKGIPMYLETEKGTAPDNRDWDVVNLERLRSLTPEA